MSEPALVLWNGEPAASVPATSRGLHYGDGVFRTLRQHQGEVIALDRQLAKLGHDAARLGLRVPDEILLRADLALAGRLGNASIKLVLSRAGTQRGYRPASDQVDRLLLAYPAAGSSREAIEGIAAIRSPVTLAAQPLLAGIKHLNRLEQVLASRDWPAGVDEAILGDDRGAPVCATRANLFWVRHGVLHTPALDRCGVAGVTRDRVLADARAIGIECRIGSPPWSQLLAADEAFVTGSLIGIWPLSRLDDHRFPDERPLTRRLQRRLAHPSHVQILENR